MFNAMYRINVHIFYLYQRFRLSGREISRIGTLVQGGMEVKVKPFAVGVDIGGTKVAIGIIDAKGCVAASTIIPTNVSILATEMVAQIAEHILRLLDKKGITMEQVAGIGIGAPGPLDAKQGKLICPVNLPSWDDFCVVEELKRKISVPVLLQNDANCAALAENWAGNAQGCEHFIYLTISTGIGAGVVIDKKLVSGYRGNAGEVGHIVIDPAQGRCACGQKGCFEWVASGTAIARRASEVMGTKLTTKEVFALYRKNEPRIVPLIEEAFTYIGMGCVALINLFDPERIVIGGGVAEVRSSICSGSKVCEKPYAKPGGTQYSDRSSAVEKRCGNDRRSRFDTCKL